MRALPNNPDDLEPERPPGGLQLADVYYMLFRHKWKLLICTLAGLVAAGVLFQIKNPPFVSKAKLMVHYVVEPMTLSQGQDVRSADPRGDAVISSEIEILTSFDMALAVASAMGPTGPSRILQTTNFSQFTVSPEIAAAGRILRYLKADPPTRGSVITVEFSHADRQVTQDVLTQFIKSYFLKHRVIHGSTGPMDEAMNKRVDELRLKIANTEAQIKQLKSSANVGPLEDTVKANWDMINETRKALNSALAELAERNAALQRLTNTVERAKPSDLAVTNESALAASPATADAYRRLVGQLDALFRKEQEYAGQYNVSYPPFREVRRKIEEAQREKVRLEREDPTLLRTPVLAAGTSTLTSDPVGLLISQEASRAEGLTAKIAAFNNQLAVLRQEAATVEDVEYHVLELQRLKESYEIELKAYAAALERGRMAENFGSGRLPNISLIQEPTPPGKNYAKLYKTIGLVAIGGFAAGLALIFLIELVLDQSVRRPGELRKKMGLSVFVTVPFLNRLRSSSVRERKALKGPDGGGSSTQLPALASISAANSEVQPYCDALRDRLVHYFQRNNMTHKPKLVAVTGCSEGAGVSTIAAGLAASLSETGDGNVLLVDTNMMEGAAHPFYRGKLACGLNDVLKEDLRGGAQVQDNLYVATASESDGALIKALPKRFSQLVPKLKASDYDYIIFDMPPVTQTSITSKLAGYMDMVLLVVESERTGRSIVSEATELLQESRANVATVLNMTRRYVPRWVHREFE